MPYLVVGGLLGGPLVTGGLGGAAVVEPEPSTATFLAALRERLLAEPALDDLAEIYLSSSDPGSVFPYLVFNRFSSAIEYHTGGYFEDVTYLLSVLSQDATEAETLADAAWAELAPGPGDSPLEFMDGTEMRQRVPGPKRGPDIQVKGRIGGDPVWRAAFACRFFLSRLYRGEG